MTTLLTGGGTRGREVLDDDVDLARDRVLVTRAQSGDRAAFDDLYVRYYRRLYRFCLRRLHDSYEAEDVAQEAFARAWRALPTFAGDRRFYPWLSVIAAHLCTDVLRRRNRSTPVAEFHQGNVASTDDGGEELMIAAVDSDLVARAFKRLSDRHQRILNLREGSGWSYQRIADHEGVGITAVETLLWRARQALKREFAALAGTEGRTAAWLGGLFSMATLRRFLRVPLNSAKRLAHLGQSAPAVAVGSAAAATAMVVAATLSGPGAGSPTSGADGPAGPVSALSTGGLKNAASQTGGGGSGLSSSNRSAASGPLAGDGGAGSTLNGAAGTVGGTANSAGGALSNGINSATNSLATILGGVSGPVGSVVNGTSQLLPGGTTLLGPVAGATQQIPGLVPTVSGPVSSSLGSVVNATNTGATTTTTPACSVLNVLSTLSGSTGSCG